MSTRTVIPRSQYLDSHVLGSGKQCDLTDRGGLQSYMDHRSDDIKLELERLKLVVNPRIGASIVSLMLKDDSGVWAPVFRTMKSDSETSSDAGSFVMAPWTNRVKDARFSYAKKDYALKSNADDQSAIHGVGRDLPWTISDRSPITARFVLDSRTIDPNTVNYPFKFGAIQRFEIGPSSVEIDLSITNLDEIPIPVGCGHHPYIHRRLFSEADDLRIKLDVSGRYPTHECIPVGEAEDDQICQSLRAGEPIGNPGLDDVFSGFCGVAEFDWAASNVRMTMRCTENLHHVVIYTPRDPDGSSNEFVCVEPVTMVNDGFNRLNNNEADTGVVILNPNETLRTRMTLEFSRCS